MVISLVHGHVEVSMSLGALLLLHHFREVYITIHSEVGESNNRQNPQWQEGHVVSGQ